MPRVRSLAIPPTTILEAVLMATLVLTSPNSPTLLPQRRTELVYHRADWYTGLSPTVIWVVQSGARFAIKLVLRGIVHIVEMFIPTRHRSTWRVCSHVVSSWLEDWIYQFAAKYVRILREQAECSVTRE